MHGQTGAWRVPGYTEIRELGTGGAGRVVLARHDGDDTPVAIKYLSDEMMADLHFVARFRHEARLLASMDPSPHAARFYEYLETARGAAIVMELIDGVSLRAMLRSEGPTGPEAALTVLKGSLLGLAAAHSIGVVHRDYKPENVMIEADGTSKLVDFGIAAQAGEGVRAAGTPPYMAPEQWQGGKAGPASDVYAATVVFFECLTGGRPFRAQNMAALARQHQATPPPVDEVPPPLRDLVQRGMAKRPEDRFASAEEFLQALETVASDVYGPAWEDRGRRRLAALAGLLVPFFPLKENAPEAGTALAETSLGGLLSRTRMKIGLTLAGMVVIAAGTVALVQTMNGDATLQAGSSIETSSTPAIDPSSIEVEDESSVGSGDDSGDESGGEPTQDPEDATPTPAITSPEPNTLPTAPTTRPSTTTRPTPRPSLSKTARPRPTPTLRRTPKPRPSPAPVPSDGSVTVDPGGNTPANPRPSTTTRPPTTRPTQPSTQPTRPTTQPTQPSTQPTTPGTPSDPPPVLTFSPTPSSETPAVGLAAALVTTGLVPATLAMGRMRGRHRRRR
ncbi:protein kinase [Microbispora hainanensis]|jgi:serine/threonine-protein kinase|uniref:non-specific serine/threonine protein kinase n=1 Tax=Microbispora hainanensis TaxID=568844 RepID=A0ABZ1STK1_9ACTN|nr:protein kinase [Microbispora hainanensis]